MGSWLADRPALEPPSPSVQADTRQMYIYLFILGGRGSWSLWLTIHNHKTFGSLFDFSGHSVVSLAKRPWCWKEHSASWSEWSFLTLDWSVYRVHLMTSYKALSFSTKEKGTELWNIFEDWQVVYRVSFGCIFHSPASHPSDTQYRSDSILINYSCLHWACGG